MGYRVGRSCHDSVNAAMESIVSMYPMIESNDIYSIATKSVTPTGLVTLRIERNNGTATNRQIQLEQCTESAPIEWSDGVLIAAVFLLLASLGFLGGLKR